MNAPVGRRSAATAVITAAIARLMTYASPVMVTTYRESWLVAVVSSGHLSAFNPRAIASGRSSFSGRLSRCSPWTSIVRTVLSRHV
jgi:hypothetical protein